MSEEHRSASIHRSRPAPRAAAWRLAGPFGAAGFALVLGACERAPGASERAAPENAAVEAATSKPAPAEPPPDMPRVEPTAMALVPAGDYRPFYKGTTAEESISVPAFQLDRLAVSRAQFLDFVIRNPKYRKSKIKPLFAESTYLSDWAGEFDPGKDRRDEPVTFVSWFAARAFCEFHGRRLPTMVEWEHAAGADEPAAKPEPTPTSAGVRHSGEGSPFRFAMGRSAEQTGDKQAASFGQVWEWTADFNSVFVPKGAVNARDGGTNLFCGDGVRAVDATDYAGFLRHSFRNSLKANYSLKNLGFRCAKDAS